MRLEISEKTYELTLNVVWLSYFIYGELKGEINVYFKSGTQF